MTISAITLRDYQTDAVEAIRRAYGEKFKAPLLSLPTGAGKTVVFCYIASHAAKKGNRVLILAHRKELIRQAVGKLKENNINAGVIAPGFDFDAGKMVQVASVQTLVRRTRIPWQPDLIVIDEAHHATSKTYTSIVSRWPSARVLGVTATPCRADGKGLGDVFDELVSGPSMADLIQAGHLSEYDIYIPPGGFDGEAKITMGDFDRAQTEAAMSKPSLVGDVVAHYAKICPLQPAIVFCTSVRHAHTVADEFKRAGYCFEALDGATAADIREDRITALGDGRIQGICSCDIISEGTDIPIVTAAILLRPTMSEGLYLQQVGRVLRPAPGKNKAIILDHAGNVMRHGLPDDERNWGLFRTPPKREKKKRESVAIKVCEYCFAANHAMNRVCAQCGQTFKVKTKELKIKEGELQLVDKFNRPKKRGGRPYDSLIASASSLDDLLKVADIKGYKRGWAYREASRRGYL